MLGMNPRSALNYQEFLQLFQTQEAKEAHPWLNSSYRPKQMRMDAELACDQAHYYLVIKVQTRWHDLARNFREFDRERNGIVQPKDLRNVLYRFAIPITSTEFEKLWARYDTDLKGYLTCQEFLQKMGAENIPADIGLSSQIAEDNCETLKARFSNQQKKHSKLEEQQKQQTQALPISEIKKQINLGISIQDSKLSYVDFLRAFDDSRASKYQQRQKQAAPPASCTMLSLKKTLTKIKEIVTSSYDLLYKRKRALSILTSRTTHKKLQNVIRAHSWKVGKVILTPVRLRKDFKKSSPTLKNIVLTTRAIGQKIKTASATTSSLKTSGTQCLSLLMGN
ncbi:EF-hand calcium-binding domain-containing protein 6 isoform A [Alligator mississippiensis]|uniref:EF-hand calcium-binding domain-containing protein 6 isoform A n=1 Tax=Alligator mississippiensis TaxID=8496 RepID=A0A151N6I5_ALLMI|nr:EF-hand calcium-binding domain-containing protein 6 isoform A [Alligator mississippiensis]